MNRGERVPCDLPRLFRALFRPPPRQVAAHGFEHPRIEIGSPSEYEAWNERARSFLREQGRDPESLDRTDATINYARNRVLLFHLADPKDELSVAGTLEHEVLHSLLEQMGERWGARSLDLVAKEAGDPVRTGGL